MKTRTLELPSKPSKKQADETLEGWHAIKTHSGSQNALCSFERRHINRKAIPYIGLEHSLVSLVDLLDGNDFNIRSNVTFGTKVEHFLRFGKTTDGRTRDAATLGQKSKS